MRVFSTLMPTHTDAQLTQSTSNCPLRKSLQKYLPQNAVIAHKLKISKTPTQQQSHNHTHHTTIPTGIRAESGCDCSGCSAILHCLHVDCLLAHVWFYPLQYTQAYE
uniref:Uncharacterized protein n=1 Tax=Ceratitis capitata TaxID=7213 RepID=W8B897_CERCA